MLLVRRSIVSNATNVTFIDSVAGNTVTNSTSTNGVAQTFTGGAQDFSFTVPTTAYVDYAGNDFRITQTYADANLTGVGTDNTNVVEWAWTPAQAGVNVTEATASINLATQNPTVTLVPVAGTIDVTEQLNQINLAALNATISTGILVAESTQPINLNTFDPVIGTSFTLTETTEALNVATFNPTVRTAYPVIETTQPITASVHNPTVQITPPNVIEIVESTRPINATAFDAVIQLFGTIEVEESQGVITLNTQAPAIQEGEIDVVNTFTGRVKSQAMAGILQKQEFSGTIKQTPTFTGTFKRQAFSGVRN